jgi:DNA-binding transcriptional ArsR family regulator
MDMFHALAVPTRRSILELLARYGELTVADICEKFPISPPAISQHLKVLREARLVQMQKRAQQRIYQINPEAMLELEQWARHVTQMWDQRFDALDEVLQAEKQRTLEIQNRKDLQHAKGKSK